MLIKPPEAPAEYPIPRKLHQIWLGDQPIPAKNQEWAEHMQAMHPDWSYRLWTEEDMPGLFEPDEFGLLAGFEKAFNYGFQSDIARLLALYREGGLYLDMDCQVMKPLDPLIATCDALIGATFWPQPYKYQGIWIENAVIGAGAGHPFLKMALEDFAAASAGWTNDDRLSTLFLTGPHALTSALRRYRETRESFESDVAVIPRRFLYDCPPGTAADRDHPDAFILHWFQGGWF